MQQGTRLGFPRRSFRQAWPLRLRDGRVAIDTLYRLCVSRDGLFTRGQTQIMSVATLGTIREELILDGLGVEESKRYIHHYNFPPYSVGETRPMRGAGRREIGHGALAEKALLPGALQ